MSSRFGSVAMGRSLWVGRGSVAMGRCGSVAVGRHWSVWVCRRSLGDDCCRPIVVGIGRCGVVTLVRSRLP